MVQILQKHYSNNINLSKNVAFMSILRKSEIVGLKEEWRILEGRNRARLNTEKEILDRSRTEFEKRERLRLEQSFSKRLKQERDMWVKEESGKLRIHQMNVNYNKIMA